MPIAPAWLNEPGLQQFFTATEMRGGEARAVGGCVRDHLLGIKGSDVDVASTLLPQQTIALAEEKGWKAVPTGIHHGTVTIVLPERAVEVTTLRRDVRTDGRHAEVVFTERFEEDAARRDFTINALYMDFRGIITDFYQGQADIRARRICFIGEAGDRIREDGLRILRYFRFLATHGQPPADEAAIRACAAQRGMLEKLSGERISQEMKKLLACSDPSYALTHMAAMALGELLTGAAWQVAMLQRLVQLDMQHRTVGHGWVRLLALVDPAQRIAVAAKVVERWRLSRADTQWLEFLTCPPLLDDTAQVKEALRHYKREWIEQALLLQSLTEPVALDRLLPVARSFDPPTFPVTARDLLARGMREGPELGEMLRLLEKRWIESDYRLTREQLLN